MEKKHSRKKSIRRKISFRKEKENFESIGQSVNVSAKSISNYFNNNNPNPFKKSKFSFSISLITVLRL
jgi:hypothetical protein